VAEAAGRPLDEVFHVLAEHSRVPAESAAATVLSRGRAGGDEQNTLLVSRDGTERPIEDSGAPIRGPDGAVAGVVMVFKDDTERRSAQQALRESEAQYRAVFDAAAVGHAELELGSGRLLRVNPRCCELTGYTAQELLGMTFSQLLHPDDRQAHRARLDRFERQEQAELEVEERLQRRDGEDVCVQLACALVRDASGAPVRLLVAALDISARKEAEREVRQLAAALERRVEERTRQLSEANAELEAFSYTVSHDLRAPLRAMQGFAQAVEEDYADKLDDDGRDYLGRIGAAARRMEVLIQDLLDYGRLAREEVRLRDTHLSSALRDALGQVAADLERRQAQIEVIEPLPAVRAYPPVLAQVLANLLSNAVKFVPSALSPQVKVRAERRQGWVRLWVEDNGIGIKAEHQERIFRMFERLHGQEAYPGTGVGLAIVRKGTERMGGRCGVDSEPGSGSRFWIELQASDAESG
jgi:PAS domain S-box-containing protein